jgi:hypothetical protein
MRGLFAVVTAAALWLVIGVAAAQDVGADRATGFVAAAPDSVETFGGTQLTVLLSITGIAVLAAVVFLLVGGGRARKSRASLDRLDSQLETLDE